MAHDDAVELAAMVGGRVIYPGGPGWGVGINTPKGVVILRSEGWAFQTAEGVTELPEGV